MTPSSNHKKDQFDCIISGAGIAGMIMALQLASHGLHCALIDPSPHHQGLDDARKSTPDGGAHTVALMQESLKILKHIGVLDRLTPLSGRLQTMRIIDTCATNPISSRRARQSTQTSAFPCHEFDAMEINETYFGLNIPAVFLHAALFDQILAAPYADYITPFLGQEISDITHDAASTKIDIAPSGRSISAKLLIAADGRHSPSRDMAGIKTHLHHYGQDAITFIVTHSRPHNSTSTEIYRPAGPLTFVPLHPNYGPDRSCNSAIVWVERHDRAQELMTMSRPYFAQALQDASHGIMGEINLITPPKSTPLIRMNADRLTAPRLALIAEAAHVIHPMGAQGLNLSCRDIRDLTQSIVKQHLLGLDIGADHMLKSYAQMRQADIQSRLAGTHGLAKALNHDHPILHKMRQVALRAASAPTPLKQFLMKRGFSF